MESIYDQYKALTGRPTPKVQGVFSRVIVAVRKKGSKSLRLKGYKNVPVGGLEQLLPDGKVRMRSFDRNLLILMCLEERLEKSSVEGIQKCSCWRIRATL